MQGSCTVPLTLNTLAGQGPRVCPFGVPVCAAFLASLDLLILSCSAAMGDDEVSRHFVGLLIHGP